MTDDQTIDAYKLIKSLFPAATDELLTLAAKTLRPFRDATLVMSVVRRHRTNSEFLRLSKLVREIGNAQRSLTDASKLAESEAQKRSEERADLAATADKEFSDLTRRFEQLCEIADISNLVHAAADHYARADNKFMADSLLGLWRKHIADPQSNPLGALFMTSILASAATAITIVGSEI